MKKITVCILLTSLLLCALSGCRAEKAPEERGGLSVLTSNFAAYDFCCRLSAGRAEVAMLMPPGVESHSFEPSVGDILALEGCNLFVCVGGESEAWLKDLLDGNERIDCQILRMMDSVTLVLESGGDVGEYDEHVWTSPVNAKNICEDISQALCALDPQGEGQYRDALAEYQSQLDALDKTFRAITENGSRHVIMVGDRFPLKYFTDEYDLDYMAAFPSCSTDTEPSAAKLAEMIRYTEANAIPVVFYLELSNQKMADTLCESTGAVKREFNSCHNISAEDFASGLGYLDFMYKNAKYLKEALN